MTNPRRSLVGSYIAFGIATALVIAAIIVSIVSAQQGIEQAPQNEALTPAPVKVDTQPIKPAEAQQSVENAPDQSTSAPVPVKNTEAAPQRTTGAEVPKPQQMERIPFTQKDVTPGDPESYVDTYGQCPFYENGGPKGCYPPPDIECNADWSECHPKEL